MFGFLKNIFNKKMTTEEVASLLKTNPELIKKFEESYNNNILLANNDSDNLFDHNSREASLDRAKNHRDTVFYEVIENIVKELMAQSNVIEFDGEKILYHFPEEKLPVALVGLNEVNSLPLENRPQLTGHFLYDRYGFSR